MKKHRWKPGSKKQQAKHRRALQNQNNQNRIWFVLFAFLYIVIDCVNCWPPHGHGRSQFLWISPCVCVSVPVHATYIYLYYIVVFYVQPFKCANTFSIWRIKAHHWCEIYEPCPICPLYSFANKARLFVCAWSEIHFFFLQNVIHQYHR